MEEIKNVGVLFASALVENFIRHGVRQFFLAPGSRNSPFLYSVLSNSKAKYRVHFDERGLGFLALGYSKRTLEPSAICVTSGTALANVYPAVLEARYSGVPLLVLSADRSFEELYNHSDQSMDQHRLYQAGLVEYFYHPSPSPSVSLASSLSLSSQIAFCLKEKKVVHLNVSFKKPFDPHISTPVGEENALVYRTWMDKKRPYTENFCDDRSKKTIPETSALLDNRSKKVFFLIGKMHPKKERAVVELLSKASLSFFSEISNETPSFVPYFSLCAPFLKEKPDLIVHLGQNLISASVRAFMREARAGGSHIVYVCKDFIVDPEAVVGERFSFDEVDFLESLLEKKDVVAWRPKTPSEAVKRILESEFQSHYSELSAFARLWKEIPPGSLVFIANSMPIRHHLLYHSCNEPKKDVEIFSNRGLSGVDGVVATFCGLLTADPPPKKAVLILGDLSFLHDLNSLSLLSKTKNALLIVINNGGGAIFKYLPIAGVENDIFNAAFFTPHGQKSFQRVAEQFRLQYRSARSLEDLEEIKKLLDQEEPSLLEIFVNADETLKIEERIKSKIGELF